MSTRISPTTPATAPERTRTILDGIRKKLGSVPNLYATIGHSPAALEGYLGLSDSLGTGSLSLREVELLNLHVSELNGCGYCLSAHSLLAARAGASPDDVAAARAGQAPSARERAILGLARRVVRAGGAHAGGELAAARAAGLSDGEIIEVLAHVASRAFANSVAILAETEIDFPKAPHLPEP